MLVLLAAFVLLLGQAWIVPAAALPNNTISDLLGRQNPQTPPDSLPKYLVSCSGHQMPNDFGISEMMAKDMMIVSCEYEGYQIPAWDGHTWKFNDQAQVYFCNYNENQQKPCNGKLYDWAKGEIDAKCGCEQGGWLRYDGAEVSIGRDPAGIEECWH